MRLLAACARHPWSVLMVAAGVILFGTVALVRLDVELLPVVPVPVAHVITEYEDIPAPEVEEMLTVRLENALSSVRGVRRIASLSKRGISRVTLYFDWSSDIELSAVEVREKIDALFPLLPQGCAKPLVLTEDVNEQPLFTLAVFPAAAGHAPRRLGPLLQEELKTRLLQIREVADVRLVGAEEAEILVEVDAFRLYDSGLLLQNVVDTLQCSVYDQPAGLVRDGPREMPLKISGGVETLSDLASIPLLGPAGAPATSLKELAALSRGLKERTSFFHYNGRDAVGVFLYKSGGLGSLNAAAGIRRRLETLRELFRDELRLELIEDRSARIRQAVRSLLAAILLGIAAATGVLLLLSRTALPALIVAAAIPVSVCAAFLGMYAAGVSLNVISLSGMAMGVGLIVDNAIVVLEYLCRRRPGGPEAIARCALQMCGPAFGSTATTLLVFLPLIFIPGMIGALFKDLALTLCFLLTASYLTAVTMMPALYVLARAGLGKVAFRTAALERPYGRMLERLLARPLPVLAACLLLSGAGLLCLGLLEKEALPAGGARGLALEISLPPGTPLEETAMLSSRIEESLLELPEVGAVFAEAGYDVNSLKDRSARGREATRLRIRLFPAATGGRQPENTPAEHGVAELLAGLGLSDYRLFRPREQVETLLGFSDSQTLLLSGNVREELLARAVEIRDRCSRLALISGSELDTRRDTREARLILDRRALAFHGLEAEAVRKTLSIAVRGAVPARLQGEEGDADIRVRLKRRYTDAAESLGRLRIPSPSGAVELCRVANLGQTVVFGELHRLDRKPAVEIAFQPAPGRNRALKAFLLTLQSPGTELTSMSELAASRLQMLQLILLAVALMYLIVGAQFESLTAGLLILAVLPLSLAGGLIFLYLSGKSVNLNSFLGLLILLGLSLNTTILLAASSGRPGARPSVVLRGSVSRLNPIVATTLTTVCALLPLLFFSTSQSHMATAVIGGLLSGTPAGLLVFPLLYARKARPKRFRPAGPGR